MRLHLPEEPASGESALEFEGEILEISVPVGDTLNDLGRVVGALEDIGSQADNASGHDAIGSAGEHLDESVYGLELVRLSDSLARGAGPSVIHPSHVAANAVGVWGRQSLPQPSARFGHRFLIAPGIYTKVRGS